MDFLRIVRSLEDLLYEVIAWLVFYPRTLWRILRHPHATLHYADRELGDTSDDQYSDTLSPPLFLMLTVLVAHGIELGIGAAVSSPRSTIGKLLVSSEQNLLLVRSLLFSIYALVGATTLMRHRGGRLDRKTLRGPFFAQCYVTAPFALGLSCAGIMGRTSPEAVRLAGAAVGVISILWYLAVQTLWFRQQLSASTSRAVLLAVWCFAQAAAYIAVVNVVLLSVDR